MRRSTWPCAAALLLASGSARADPPAPRSPEATLECRANFDCRSGFVCRDEKCVRWHPELDAPPPDAPPEEDTRSVGCRIPRFPHSKPGLWGPGIALLAIGAAFTIPGALLLSSRGPATGDDPGGDAIAGGALLGAGAIHLLVGAALAVTGATTPSRDPPTRASTQPGWSVAPLVLTPARGFAGHAHNEAPAGLGVVGTF
jgi:hypothetical protein